MIENFDELPKSQQKTLAVLYKHYKECCDDQKPRKQCNDFGTFSDVYINFFTGEHPENILDDLIKLRSHGFIFAKPTKFERLIGITLTDRAISYFENKFKNNAISLIHFIKDLI